MRLVGYNDLQARSAYQPTIVHQGDRYLAYIGHHGGTADMPKPVNPLTGQPEFNGTSIVDVTDPAHPKYLKHIPGAEGGAEGGGAQMVRVCPGASLPQGRSQQVLHAAHVRHQGARGLGRHRSGQAGAAGEDRRRLSATRTRAGGNATPASPTWSPAVPGWRVKRMTEIYDLSDPAHPVKIRDFGLPGQEPGSTGPVPTELHGPISMPQINRVYFGYGSSKGGILQIVDREKLLQGPEGADARQPALSGDQPDGACRRWSARIRRSRCCRCRSPSSPRTASPPATS